jgi:hypothetical protein
MAAGHYHFDNTVGGGGNDADGYTLGTGANKSMTFIVQTYNGTDNVVFLDGVGATTINCGTGTIAFQAATAGVQTITYSGTSLTLTTGTLDVSGITFNATAALTTINRDRGVFLGAPVYANAAMIVNYTDAGSTATSITANAEIPATLARIVLSSANAAGTTVTFPSAITFVGAGNGISATTNNTIAVFSSKVTLQAIAAAVSPTIVNSSTKKWTFAGGVDVQSTSAANGVVVDNQTTGSIEVTGALTFIQRDIAGTNNGNNTSTVQNTGGGAGALKLTGGVVEVATGFDATLVTSHFSAARTSVVNGINATTGKMSIGGGVSTTFTGTFTTGAAAGTVTLTGPVSVNGAFVNGTAHTIALGANNLTLAGAFTTTGGVITSSGIGSGYVIFAEGSSETAGGGTFPNIKSTKATGALTVTSAATLNGNVESSSAVGLTVAGATTISGDVINNGAGLITLSAAALINGNLTSNTGGVLLSVPGSVNGSVSIAGGTVTTNATAFAGTVTITGGTLLLGGNTTVMGAYTQTTGTLDFGGAFTLALKSNFTRNSGVVTPATGTLEFSAGGAQTFIGGTNLRVYNFNVTGVGTGVAFSNGSLEVMNNANIVANTNVQLGTYNIRMLGMGGGLPTFTNGGQYTSTGGGGILFTGPLAGQFYISGNGVNSNIDVRLDNQNSTVDIAAGQTVTWSGVLTLTRGTINVPAGTVFNPSTTLTTPTIRRNLGDAALTAAGADGRPIVVGGAFNNTNRSYNLEYFSLDAMSANENVGPEFVVGATRVINFSVAAKGLAGQQVVLPVAGLYQFSGNLFVGNSSVVSLAGATGVDDLVSTGAAATHTINGKIISAATAGLVLQGDGTVNGGTVLTPAPADDALIENLVVNTTTTSATYAINNLKWIGRTGTADGLTITAGTVNLGMQSYSSAPVIIGTLFNTTVAGGVLNLTADANFAITLALTGGTFDFKNFNANVSVAAGAVTATGGNFLATGATTKGYLVYKTSGTINTGTVLVPRIALTNAVTLTVLGNSGVSDAFVDYDATGPGTLALGANTFTIAGTNWDSKAGLYTGTGSVAITGATNVKLAASITLPNLTINNGTNVATLIDNDGAAGTVPDLTVSTLLTMTAGSLNMQTVDILLPNAGAAFAYTAGTINATTGTAVPLTDITYGELTFSAGAAQSFSITSTNALTIPNLTITAGSALTYTGGSAAAAPTFTVSKYLKMGANIVMGADGKLVIGDGAWIEALAAVTMDKVPAFAGNVNYLYNGLLATGKELTVSATKIQKFYVNVGALTLSAPTTVNKELKLISGDVVTTATNTLTMGANTLVTRIDGTINVAATAGANLLGGPINLTYLNTAKTTTLDGEYPAAIVVDTLTVATNMGASAAGTAAPLALHASRTCTDLILLTDGAATPQNGTQFDLNGFTLTVSNVSSATLTRGALVSYKVTAGTYVYGTLAVAGKLTMTSAASIKNVNVTAATANLAGIFGTEDYDLAGPNVLPFTLPTMGVTGVATIAGFNGNLTVGGNVTINGAYTGGNLIAGANVTIGAGGSMTPLCNLTLNGTANNDTLTVPTGGATIGSLTLTKTSTTPSTVYYIYLSGGDVTCLGDVFFVNGLLRTSATNALVISNSGGASADKGFVRSVAVTDKSHVVGNVRQNLEYSSLISWARNEFPVGDSVNYRPAAITVYVPSQVLNHNWLGVVATVRHENVRPTGTAGLPIANGIVDGVDLSRYPSFYWSIKTSQEMGATPFNLDLTAAGFKASEIDIADLGVNRVKIIRRSGVITDTLNEWNLQGLRDSYDNVISAGIPDVTALNATGGLSTTGAIFTYGLKSTLFVANTIADKSVMATKTLTVKVGKVFSGNAGTFTYTVKSSNTAVATVAFHAADTSVVVTGVIAGGPVVITVTGKDVDNSQISTTFNVTVGPLVGVEKIEIPTEFSLSQNYPNPFNPSTTIKFGLPVASNVSLKIYNILGEQVASLVNKVMPAGYNTVTFDASKLASGMYIYRIEAGSFVQVKKMMMLK